MKTERCCIIHLVLYGSDYREHEADSRLAFTTVIVILYLIIRISTWFTYHHGQ